MFVTEIDYDIMHTDGWMKGVRQKFGHNKGKEPVLEERDAAERRRFRRFRHVKPVQFQFKDPQQYGGCLSYDLSEGGIRIHLYEFAPLHAEVTIQIQLAKENIIKCASRIAWVEKNRFGEHYQAGLEFKNDGSIQQDFQKEIHGFLSSQWHQLS